MGEQLLNREDSIRVANALIKKINSADFNVADAVASVVRSVLVPRTVIGRDEAWFKNMMEQTADRIANSIRESAERNTNK